MSIGIKDFRMAIKIDNSDAKQKLAETSAEVRKLEKELKDLEATDKKNTEEYKKAKARLDELNKSYNDLRKEAGLNAMTYDELRKSAKSLKRQLDKTVPDTAEWKELQADLQITRARMKELSGQANETRFSIAKLADGFNRYGTMAATAVASLTGLTLTMRKCVDDYAEMEEAQSQVIKYTGLSKEAVNELNEEFKNMDTRTPRTRLNELAGDAGKLGISTKEGVLEFVEAANMINVALGEDLGKDAITQIGKLAGMFGEGDRSLKENMLAVGSAVNSVAQNSAASEPYLVEFTARMGGVGKQAKLAVTDIMGYASALDQNMLRSEMASTALQGLILKLYQEPAQYAKLAGIEVEAFTKMMETDANEAVLTFLEALGRLGGMDQMAPVLKEMKLSGAEAAGVIAALAGNVEKVRKEQEGANKAYMEATSVVNEYNVQNSTVQAELDKAKQRFADIRVELGQQLLPIMKYMITTGSLTVKGLSAIVHVLLEYKDIILTAVTAITTYTFTVNAASLVTKSFAAITKVSANAVALLNKVTKVSPWGLVISGLTSVIAYLTIYKDKVDDSKISLEAMNNISSKTDSEFSKQASKIDRLTDIINDNRLSIDQRRKAINDLKSIIPDYNAKLSEEGIIISQNTDAIQTYLAQLEKQIKLKAAQEELEELYRQKRKNDIEINRLAAEEEVKRNKLNAAQNAATLSSSSMTTSGTKALSSGLNVSVQSLQSQHRKVQDLLEESRNKAIQLNNAIKLLNDEISSSDIADKVNSINESNNIFTDPQLGDGNSEAKDKLAELEKSLRQEQNLIKKQYQTGEIDEENYQSKLYQIQVKYIGLKIELLKKYGEDTSSAEGQLLDLMISEANKNYQKELDTKKENLDNEVKAEEIGYSRKQLALKNHYADSLISKEEYDKQLEQLEIQHLEKLKQIRQSYGEDTGDIDATLADKGVKKREQGDKQKVDSGLKGIDLAKSEENALQILDSMYEAGLISYEQYEQQKTAITERWENERNNIRKNAFNTAMNLISSVSDLMSAMQDSEISNVERWYDKKIQAAEKAGKDTTKLEEEKEAAVMEVKKKYADKQFALNILEVASKTALAIMAAWTAGPILGPILGAIAAAQGAAQIAIAKQQRDEAKGLYTGGYSQDYVEGYTKKGNSKDVAGVIPVHKNEFVTNHEGVANPHVKQFLDVFDVAQKKGTIGMINTTQILEQVRTKSGRYSGGYTSNSSVSGSQSNYSSGDVHSMLNVIIQLLRKSNENLSAIAAKKLTVDVRSVRDGIKRIETLERNASR